MLTVLNPTVITLPHGILWGNGDDRYTIAYLKIADTTLQIFAFTDWGEGQSLEVYELDAELNWRLSYRNATDQPDMKGIEIFPEELDALIAAWPDIPPLINGSKDRTSHWGSSVAFAPSTTPDHMKRYGLTDAQWERLRPLLSPSLTGRGRRHKYDRMTVEGVLWRLATGAAWARMPARFGPWQTAYACFRRWQEAGVWSRMLAELQTMTDTNGKLDWRRQFMEEEIAAPDSTGSTRGEQVDHQP